MSGFKRMQSKVFWGQMASQDLSHSPLISASDTENSAGNTNSAGIGSSSHGGYYNNAMHSDTSQESLRESDASDGNLTAIRVNGSRSHVENDVSDRNVSDNRVNEIVSEKETYERKRITAESPDRTSDGNLKMQDTVDGMAIERCSRTVIECKSSPSARNRSLDSGFSDSDSSSSPDINYDGMPNNRHRKGRRSLTRGRPQLSQRMHHRLSSLWKVSDQPSNPAHTSTPKAERHATSSRTLDAARKNILDISWRQMPNAQRFEENQENNSASPSIDDECLQEFLYVTEPPEDEDVFSNVSPIAKVSGSSIRTRCRESPYRSGIQSRNFDQHTAVRTWLSHLVMETGDECCITLQSKALPRRKFRETMNEESHARNLTMLTSLATAAATELLMCADGFSSHYQQVVAKLQLNSLESGRFERELLRSYEKDGFSILSKLGASPPRRIQGSNIRSILSQLENFRNYVDNALDARIDFYIERVVRSLEEAPCEGGSAARGALAALTALGLAGTRAGSSIARCYGVRALLTSLISATRLSSDLRASTLRALSSVCSCPLAIEQFVRNDGPEILLDLFAAEMTPEKEKMEAAALVVQITAPWTKALGLKHLEPHAIDLVYFLTGLAERTICGQTLLLSAAALNNLADSRTFIAPIMEQEAVRKLLNCVKKLAGGNVWLMEQVASLIGKLAKIPEAITHLAQARASVALVCFLRMGPPGVEDAYLRLEITAAEALTRLCVDPEIARQVVTVGGADCLPSYNYENLGAEDEEQTAGFLKYTKSLRRATRQMNFTKTFDSSITPAFSIY